jgi:hypothetical protein
LGTSWGTGSVWDNSVSHGIDQPDEHLHSIILPDRETVGSMLEEAKPGACGLLLHGRSRISWWQVSMTWPTLNGYTRLVFVDLTVHGLVQGKWAPGGTLVSLVNLHGSKRSAVAARSRTRRVCRPTEAVARARAAASFWYVGVSCRCKSPAPTGTATMAWTDTHLRRL